MSDSDKIPKIPLHKQVSLSHIEQSLKIIPGPPQQAPVTIYKGPKAGNQNLSKADLEITDRLEKLRKSHADEIPTEEEMAVRLAKLKGLQSDHFTKPKKYYYQPPDIRSQTEKSEDLLKQVMAEVALDSKIVKSEDPLQAQIASLHDNRGISTSFGETFNKYEKKPEVSLKNEVAELMNEAQTEMSNAKTSFESLKKDPNIKTALKISASKKGKQETTASSTSSDELYSGNDGDDDDDGDREMGSSDNVAKSSSQMEKEEVDRVVNLYTEKARRRKEKRKLRALKRKEKQGGKVGSTSSSLSDRELTESDLVSPTTSESEKFSDSD